ncbi:hypothetical protein JCM3770_003329 [Rhodotorula araucariae]
MIPPTLYLACFLAVAVHTGTALPVPLFSSTSSILPAAWSPSNPQRPFTRQVAPPRLRIVDDDDDERDSYATAVGSSVAGRASPYASLTAVLAEPTPVAAPANPSRALARRAKKFVDDSIFTDAELPAGVEASIAAVLAARRAEEVERSRQLSAREWAVIGKRELQQRERAAYEAQQLHRTVAVERDNADRVGRIASFSITTSSVTSSTDRSDPAGVPAPSQLIADTI